MTPATDSLIRQISGQGTLAIVQRWLIIALLFSIRCDVHQMTETCSR